MTKSTTKVAHRWFFRCVRVRARARTRRAARVLSVVYVRCDAGATQLDARLATCKATLARWMGRARLTKPIALETWAERF